MKEDPEVISELALGAALLAATFSLRLPQQSLNMAVVVLPARARHSLCGAGPRRTGTVGPLLAVLPDQVAISPVFEASDRSRLKGSC